MNPAAPIPPWVFSIVDFTALEKRALYIQEASGERTAAEEIKPERVWETDPLTPRQIAIEEWRVFGVIESPWGRGMIR